MKVTSPATWPITSLRRVKRKSTFSEATSKTNMVHLSTPRPIGPLSNASTRGSLYAATFERPRTSFVLAANILRRPETAQRNGFHQLTGQVVTVTPRPGLVCAPSRTSLPTLSTFRILVEQPPRRSRSGAKTLCPAQRKAQVTAGRQVMPRRQHARMELIACRCVPPDCAAKNFVLSIRSTSGLRPGGAVSPSGAARPLHEGCAPTPRD
jgi:hypothetical protein